MSSPSVQVLCGDCIAVMREMDAESVDVVIADPPYGTTSLQWDVPIGDWLALVRPLLKSHGSVWVFGSLRSLITQAHLLRGWVIAQDIVWEKHNGSIFHADRFRRVHEHIVHLYPESRAWSDIYKSVVTTPDATARTVRRKARPAHAGHIEDSAYASIDGGPRIMRSVLHVPSCHGYAVHPTQKPLGVIEPLIEYSCPPDGTVLDPFLGSGSVLVAAASLGRGGLGIEIDSAYAAIARNRLSSVQPHLPLEEQPA